MIYGYLRVSTEAQDLESQKVGIDSYCEKNNITIGQWVEEKVSGVKEIKSRRLGSLQARLRKGDTLIVSEISRLGRSSLMILSLVEKLFKRGVTMIFIKQGLTLDANETSLQSMMSKMFVCFSALYAEMERELMRERVKEGIKRRIKSGLSFGCPKGQIKQNSPMKKFLPEMARLYQEGKSLTDLVRLYGFSATAIWKAFKVSGVVVRPRGRCAA